ncbi:RNA helicase [Aeromonas hydrophila]|nr:RNA helicase [Aeromonas hydrophila]
MPISKSQGLEPEHWLNVKGIICEALADTEFDVRLVSDSDDVGVIHKSIVQNIYKNDIVICDVSTHNANVMFELGLRLAFDKPTVIIKDDETPFSFDTQVIEHIVYKRSLHYVDIVSFKKKLKDKVLATLEQSRQPDFSTFLGHFTINHVSKIEERTVSVTDALVERIDQMQNTINMVASQQIKQSNYRGEIHIDPFGRRQISGAESTFRKNVRAYLNSMSNAADMDEKTFANYLSNMSDESEESLIKQFYSSGLSFNKNGLPFPPSVIKNEIKAFIDEAGRNT